MLRLTMVVVVSTMLMGFLSRSLPRPRAGSAASRSDHCARVSRRQSMPYWALHTPSQAQERARTVEADILDVGETAAYSGSHQLSSWLISDLGQVAS